MRRSPRRNRHITTTPSFTGHIANSTLTTQRNTNSNSSALYLAITKDRKILQVLHEIFKYSVRLPRYLKTNQNNSSACNIIIFFLVCLQVYIHTKRLQLLLMPESRFSALLFSSRKPFRVLLFFSCQTSLLNRSGNSVIALPSVAVFQYHNSG